MTKRKKKVVALKEVEKEKAEQPDPNKPKVAKTEDEAEKEKAPEPVVKTIKVCGQKVTGVVLNGKITTKEGVTYDCP